MITNGDPTKILRKVAENQHVFEETSRSWKRHIPFWQLRKQYAMLKENEALLAKIGVQLEPLWLDTEGSWLLKKLIGVK